MATDSPQAAWQDGLPEGLVAGLTRRQIPTLGGLRAIAAWTVVFYHLGLRAAPSAQAVVFFFVLSGFLITWLLLAEETRLGRVSLKRFYIRRTLRIFPAFYAYWLASVAVLTALHQPLAWPVMWAAFFYVSNWYHAIHGVVGSAVSHCWSLGLEEQYYLLWPPVCLWIGRQRVRRHVWVGVVIAAIWLHRALALQRGVSFDYLYHALDTRVDQVLVGSWLALALHAGLLRRLAHTLHRHLWLLPLNLVLLAWQMSRDAQPGWSGLLGVGLAVEPLLMAILLLQLMTHHAHRAVRWLDARPLAHLGALSYSTYVWHQLPVAGIRTLHPHWPWALKLPVAIGAVLLASHVSWWLVEQPFARLKLRLMRAPG